MEKRISIVLPTFNEGDFIEKTVNSVFENFKNVELIVVDDNSTDKTIEKLNTLKNKFNFNLIIRKKAKGFASAINRGIMFSSGDYIGYFDVNSPEQLFYFTKLKKALDEGNDIAILSRYVKGGGDKRIILRSSSSWLINFVCRILLRVPVRDFSGGLFLFKREILDEVTIIPYGHGEFFIEFIYDAVKKGFKVKEIPYIQSSDSLTNSKSNPNLLRFLYLGFLYFIRIFITLLRRN